MQDPRDFTFATYENLLRYLLDESSYEIRTVEQFLASNENNTVVLRHDVDRNPKNSLAMAVMENRLNICATYYFRAVAESYNEKIIQQIVDLGHEVGYHYEDLAQAGGIYDRAIVSFERNLKLLRKFYPVSTVCMHGSPLSKWDNRLLWQKYDYKEFGVTGEPYFDIDFNEVFYVTDAGRSWNDENVNIRDHVSSKFYFPLNSTQDIVKLIEAKTLPGRVLINVHPHNWARNALEWWWILSWQTTKNVGKRMLNRCR